MFNSLTGTITGKFPKKLYILTNGIEWDICVPDSTLDDFSAVGQEGKVYTYLNHYENGMDLYGFPDETVRSLFFDLLKVDGIGPKGAVKILSSIKSSELISVLESGKLEVLEKIQGIGKKTAAKMLLTLQGKLTISENVQQKTINLQKNVEFDIVISSLCDMGYERIKTQEIVEKIAEELKNSESFKNKNQTEKEDFVFKQALMELAK